MSEEEQPLSILEMPLELIASVIGHLDFHSHFAVSECCRYLHTAEALARLSVEVLSFYRTDDGEFTLGAKDKLSDTWMHVQNVNGKNITYWMDDDDTSFKIMKRESHQVGFQGNETPLGELEETLQEYLKRAYIDKLIIDGFHCSDWSMGELCRLVKNRSIDTLRLVAPFSTTSDAGLLDILYSCSKVQSFTLAIHRCTPKEFVLERDFLLYAVSRLNTFVVHSRMLRELHSVDNTVINDDLLLRLCSTKCTHLQLLYYMPLLTAEGIKTAIEHFVSRGESKLKLKTYFRSELQEPLWNLLGHKYIENLSTKMRGMILKIEITRSSDEYCKIVVGKTPLANGIPTIELSNERN
ncbi:hypothetical protein PRIPAC_94957 [Pristionchus pacificus]|nr:hypothetical protein PRIPAC_94957 [Pristionchus pacificus]